MLSYDELYARSIKDPQGFWAEQASVLPWFEFPKEILREDKPGFYKWFSDGKFNMSYACLDFHVANGRGNQVAVYYDSPVTQTKKSFTYAELLDKVSRFAAGMQKLGVEKGDTVIIYMPMIPEAVVAMLACARIGAIHSVVFGGFAPHELALRLEDAEPKLIISASYGMEFDRKIDYKPLVDKAISESSWKPEYCIYQQRENNYDTLQPGYEIDFDEVYADEKAKAVPVLSTDPLYILYTSGTTGKPKGVVRDHGGYASALLFSMKYVYDAEPGETYWAASDVGWVVGHSYIVYAPLLQGCSTVLYEGKPVRTPDAGAFWRVMEEYRVSVMFTAPTAIRAIKKEDHDGELLKKYDLSKLKYLFLAGERCDPATFDWIAALLQKPVIDHWWQTESGWPMLATMMKTEPHISKSGSAGRPVCGFDIRILTEDGQVQEQGKEGIVAVKLPLPPGCLPTLWKNDERFRNGYLLPYPGYYFTGDGGFADEENCFHIMGRVDDVINVSGHRLSTGEMEAMVATHPAVAECAVIGMADQLRGQVPLGLVVLKNGFSISESAIEKELVALVREQIGALACFKTVIVVHRLPKTRSGKILRKTMRQLVDEGTCIVPSTIDDVQILEELKTAFTQKTIGWFQNTLSPLE